MDLSKVSTEDLQAYQAGDLSKVSTAGLQAMSAPDTAPATPTPDPRGAKIDAYLAQTDALLKFPAGTSARQIYQESKFDDAALNKGSKAAGLAQVIPATVQSLSLRAGRVLDPANTDDALFMHRTLMTENMKRFGNTADALRAYNSGWLPGKWDNKETNDYIATVLPQGGSAAGPAGTTIKAPAGSPKDPYVPWGAVVKDIPVTSLAANPDWLSAARQLYNWDQRKQFTGSDAELDAWGQNEMSWSGNNTAVMATDAAALVSHGTPDDMRAYLHGMDQWDTAKGNLSTFGRSVGQSLTDPINIAGAGTLGAATVAKIAASTAAKFAVRKMLITAIGRSGIQGAISGSLQGSTKSFVDQVIRTGAGEQDSVSMGRVGTNAAVGAAVGLGLGTAGDMLLSVAVPVVQKGIAAIMRVIGTENERVLANGTKQVKLLDSEGEHYWADAPVDAPKVSPVAPAVPAVPGTPVTVTKTTTTTSTTVTNKTVGKASVTASLRVQEGIGEGKRTVIQVLPDGSSQTLMSGPDGKHYWGDAPKPGLLDPTAPGVPVQFPSSKAAKAAGEAAGPVVAPITAPTPVVPNTAPTAPVGTLAAPSVVADPSLQLVKDAAKEAGIQIDPTPTLPKELAGASPRWKTSTVAFENDIDKALYITSQGKKSKSDGAYRDWLKTQGLDDAAIDAQGVIVRDAMKKQGALVQAGGEIRFADTRPLSPTVTPEPSPHGNVPVDSTVTDPIPTMLTADEIAASVTRGQKGRIWVDDLPSVGPQNERPWKSLVIPELDGATSLRHTAVDIEGDLMPRAEAVAAQLRAMSESDLRAALEVGRSSMRIAQAPTVFMAGQMLHNELRATEITITKALIKETDPALIKGLQSQLSDVQGRLDSVARFDDATGSFGGSINRQRQTLMMDMKGMSVQEIMDREGLSMKEAVYARESAILATEISNKAKQIAGEYDARVAEAILNRDFQTANDLLVAKRRELNGVASEAFPKGDMTIDPTTGKLVIKSASKVTNTTATRTTTRTTTKSVTRIAGEAAGAVEEEAIGHAEGSTVLGKLHDLAGDIREGVLSNLFTVKTVAINAIAAAKTLALPSLHYIVENPLEKAYRAELAATYSGMRSSIGWALSAAHMAYKYEQAVITKDTGRLLPGELRIKGEIGGAIRLFPRLLNASDEFLAQVNYAGYVSGKAAFAGATEGKAKGLTGKALNDHISAAVEAAKGAMFEKPGADYLQPIVNKGVNLGYSGQALEDYVAKQAKTVGGALQHGADKEGLDYTRDVLYKRSASGGLPGDGWVKREMSHTFQHIERWMGGAPEFSLMIGQLFIRTPVRVFEEAIRLTPGVQLIAPGFMRDLVGTNGSVRQVRAQAEALTATAVAAAAMTLYSQGRISASGVYMNPQQSKNRLDGSAPPANTIHSADGTSWNFNSVDSLAIPMKIWINAFEAFDELKIKEAQEQYVNQDARRNILARISVGTMAIAQAISDSNLVGGLKRSIELAKEIADPEGDEAKLIASVGKEIGLVVPNSIKKMAQMNDPRIRNPATWMQAIESGLGLRTDTVSKTSFAYDPLGEVRTLADIGSIWSPISKTSTEDRARGHSEDHQKVMTEFDRLAQIAGTTFSPIPVKNQLTGQMDLRTVMTMDGKETLYDRWNANYRALNPAGILASFVDTPLAAGSYKYKGEKPAQMQAEMQSLQQVAFMQMMNEENIRKRMITEKLNTIKGRVGLLDFDNRNK